MTFWLAYGVFMIVQFLRKRYQSAKALCAGLVVGLVHQALITTVNFELLDQIAFYASMWLIAFGWFCYLEFAKLNMSAVVCAFLVAFQMFMVFGSINNDITESVLYTMYPDTIFLVNILMIAAGLGERDDMATASTHCTSDHKSHHKGEKAV